ncbi:hypothetical protein Q7P37_005888 [Cladosporium fusiforme]
MSFLHPNGNFPPLRENAGDVTTDERSSAVDFVNRVNLFFEENDHEKMTNAFTPDGTAYHFLGTIRGHAEMREFFRTKYTYLIPGVSRSATNHIVDRDEETGGVVIRYHELLVRYAWPKDSKAVHVMSGPRDEFVSKDGLPKVWVYTHMVERLKKTESGWKIYERYIGAATVDEKLNPIFINHWVHRSAPCFYRAGSRFSRQAERQADVDYVFHVATPLSGKGEDLLTPAAKVTTSSLESATENVYRELAHSLLRYQNARFEKL